MWADIFPPSESIENWSRQSEREQNKLQLKQVNQTRTNTNRDQLKTKGGIRTQIATLNANMKLGGRRFAALTLHVWENDTFPKFVISFLT